MNVKEAIDLRKSVRKYIPNKKISKTDIITILEAGRKAPNGFGFEAWKFHVVEHRLDKLEEAARNQTQVGTSSVSIVLTAPTNKYLENHIEELKNPLLKIGYPEENINSVMNYLGDRKGDYVREQTFFAATQMMLQATELGIGSNAIAGFDQQKVCDVLGIDSLNSQVTLIITFGYEDGNSPVKEKKKLEDIVVFH